ncbi:MAG: DUF6607 family protein [Planctomycetota bacterium]
MTRLPALTVAALAAACFLTAAPAHACPPCGCEVSTKKTTPSESKDDSTVQTEAAPASDAELTALERDRQAILAHAGEFKVKFYFAETIPLIDDYELKEPYLAGATEFVEVISDEPHRIDLQHVLVMGKGDEAMVIKHWRQTWEYEPTRVLDYRGGTSWVMRDVPAEQREGAWSQTVWQVDDSPRYGGVGKWTHEAGTSSWESEFIWRPLPRREHTKRSDYDVMGCVNRHTLSPTGWVHEQDNLKIVLDDNGEVETIIAREVGLNVYDYEGKGIAADVELDMTAGRDYWARTAPFWADVRSAMDAELADGELTLKPKVDGKPMYAHLFVYAAEIEDTYDAEAGQAFINETLASFVEPAEVASTD